jgi:hypothetical protein
MVNIFAKYYAAYRSGCLGSNILDAYFPFFATIINTEDWAIVDETQVATKFNEKYDFALPIPFVRQVLGVGIEKGTIISHQGQYHVNRKMLKDYCIDDSEFANCWLEMIDCFQAFCVSNNYDITSYDVENRILEFLDSYDEAIVSAELNRLQQSDKFDHAWHSFIKDLQTTNPRIFNFIVALSSSNIMKQTVFYTGDARDTYKGLNIYLDSPIVFALLGMDVPARIDACKMLVSEMQKAGCRVQVFDHNFQEIIGIMIRTAGWVTNADYDIQKANNVAQYFHDVLADAPAITEFCESVEPKLNEMNITIKNTIYDSTQHDFQEDEQTLYSMIDDKYSQQGMAITEEKKASIMTDVRSIVMVYREREGRVSTKIQTSGHIMITLNSTIANVSKQYESNRSILSGHIPACISSDLFGAVLWLFSPATSMEYRRKQLLADCFIALRPSREMLEKYLDSLMLARSSGEIDEKFFLFMRAHAAVNDALMNVTKGDYARFNDQTYLEVYDQIVAQANKKYGDEVLSHTQTKEQLEKEKREREKLATDIQNLQERLDARDKTDFDKKCCLWGRVYTLILIGIPYVIVLALIEIVKNYYSVFALSTFLVVCIYISVTILAGAFFNKGKKFCFLKVENYFLNKQEDV